MSSSSSSATRSANRRTVYGVPTRCWCGMSVKTFVSKTKENPYRRFSRCVIASQRETEDHLFKWEDEAIMDEIRMVDAKCLDLLHDLQSFSKTTKEHMAVQEARMLHIENGIQLNRSPFGQDTTEYTTKPLHNIAVAIAVLGAAAWFYFKLN